MERRTALEAFCRAYWAPLYGYARAKGKTPTDAEDLVQGFILKILRQPGAFERLDSSRGMLRSWLRASFSNFMVTDWQKEQTLKRGGGLEFERFELEGVERVEGAISDEPEPDKAFDRQWAHTVLSRGRRQLREAFRNAGKLDEFEVLSPCLDAGHEESSEELGVKLGKSAGAVRVAMNRLRSDFRLAVMREIADTIGVAADVDQEMKYLLECL